MQPARMAHDRTTRERLRPGDIFFSPPDSGAGHYREAR
jgi:hypothetical protein